MINQGNLRALLLSTICLASPAGAQFNSYNGIYALNNQTFGLRGNPTIISGGTGYAVNDTITLACAATGTPPVRPVISVSSVSSGAITGLTVTNAGVSTILPSSDTPATLNGGCTYTQYSTSGSGSGATFSGVLSFIPGGVFGAGTINAGTTPITGTCTSGQYLYNASGILACQTLSGGGNVSNSGTPVNGQIGIWATATTIGGTTLGTGVYSALQAVLNASGGLVGYSGALGTPTSGNIANTSGYAASNLTGTTLPAGITTASGLTTVALGTLASGAVTAAYTCPNATTSTLGCAEAGTGLLASGGVFSVAYGTTTGTALQGGGSLGTPSAGNLSNATSYPASALASGAIPGGATINDGNWSGTVLSVAHGGTGTASPGLIAGTNITSITGTWPNQTINASGGGGVSASSPNTWTAAQTFTNSDILLLGSSTGATTFTSANAGATNYTLTFPAATDTVAVLGAAQTFSGALTHSGANLFSGAAATLSANTTTVLGGTTAPTWGAAGELAVGGYYTLGTVGNTGSGGVSLSAANGLQLQGYGSSYDLVLASHAGTIALGVLSSGTVKFPGTLQTVTLQTSATGHVYASSATSPSITSGGTIGTTNGTFAFTFTATATSATTVVGMPAATTGWICPSPVDFTTPATSPLQTATTTNSVTITPYARNSTTAQATWANADVVGLVCFGY